ncbi:DUF357 domain-containing protein [Candidatus Marsarchaeota archaeon]|nr:DUF357 domain-containing protein [Candidatus Marsarchaeota archaeon]MCL5404388.1 DUF357 domain-containing protein [Candidatus Marsarchaeota archaeon]
METEDASARIKKDIMAFEESIKIAEQFSQDLRIKEIVELSKMYAADSKHYLDKGDLLTSFSCISYAHGLLDAAMSFVGASKYV